MSATYGERLAGLRSGALAYQPLHPAQLPHGVRWYVPRENQGQMVEIAYGGFGVAADEGDEYMRERGPDVGTRYYRLGPVIPVRR